MKQNGQSLTAYPKFSEIVSILQSEAKALLEIFYQQALNWSSDK